MNFNKNKTELFFILAIFLISWLLRLDINGLSLEIPITIKAADPFFHTSVTQGIIDTEQTIFMPYYLVEGHKDILDVHPYLNYITTAAITKISKVPVWNNMYLLTTLYDSLGILIIFILCKRLFSSFWIAAFSAVIYAMPSPISKWWYNMNIGIWNNVAGLLFVYATLWLTYEYIKKPEKWKLFAISLLTAAAWLVHLAELILLGFFIAVLGLFILINKNSLKNKILNCIILGSLILISIILFWANYKEWSGFSRFGLSWNWSVLPQMPFFNTLWHFPLIIVILLFIGLILLFINYKKYKAILIGESYLLVYLMILPLFLSSYYFFVRQRTALPFIIAPIAAYGLYQIIQQIFKNNNLTKNIVSAFSMIIIFSYPLINGEYNSLKQTFSYSHLSQEKYNALLWIQQNTPEDAEILFLTGYYQASSQYSKRVGFVLDQPQLIETIKEWQKDNIIPFILKIGDHGDTAPLSYKISFLKHGHYDEKDKDKMNLLDFSHVLTNDFVPEIKIFNDAVNNILINNYNYTIIYDKDNIKIVSRTK